MKKVKIESPIEARGIRVVPGWTARVPLILKVDEETMRVYGRFFQGRGKSPAEADAEVLRMCHGVFEAFWIVKLRLAMARWARLYEERFGDLEGFDPERMQGTFCPGDNWGKRGKPFVNPIFEEMRHG